MILCSVIMNYLKLKAIDEYFHLNESTSVESDNESSRELLFTDCKFFRKIDVEFMVFKAVVTTFRARNSSVKCTFRHLKKK